MATGICWPEGPESKGGGRGCQGLGWEKVPPFDRNHDVTEGFAMKLFKIGLSVLVLVGIGTGAFIYWPKGRVEQEGPATVIAAAAVNSLWVLQSLKIDQDGHRASIGLRIVSRAGS